MLGISLQQIYRYLSDEKVYHELEYARVIRDKQTNESRQFAFVKFKSVQPAARLMGLRDSQEQVESGYSRKISMDGKNFVRLEFRCVK
jgi:uncharacterized protein YcbK (DUF882 family)